MASFFKLKKILQKEIMISERNRTIIIPLHLLPGNYHDTLHVCVPPLYWYWNYVALIKFITVYKFHVLIRFQLNFKILEIYDKLF